jgi:hypothetical protein
MRRSMRNSRFGLTVAEVMQQLEPLLERIRVPAPDTNRDDMLAAYALIRELDQATSASNAAQRLLDDAMTSSRREWRELNARPPPPPPRNIVAELLERNRTGRGNTVYDTATIDGPVGFPITFNRMTTGLLPIFRMLRYLRNTVPSTRDMELTGDWMPSRSASTKTTGRPSSRSSTGSVGSTGSSKDLLYGGKRTELSRKRNN